MKHSASATAILAATTLAAHAGGLDRAGNNLGPLFEQGNYVELGFGAVNPDAAGTDVAAQPTGDVARGYGSFSLGYKQQVNDRLSFSLLIDQPYGADVRYSATTPVLGGTSATLNSMTYSITGRYLFDNGFSVHAGVRAQSLEGEVMLGGLAYGGLSGYNVKFGNDLGVGYQLGVAYERPDIALRVALTYFSEIDHTLPSTESFAPGAITGTEVTTPEAFNLDFQTGIAENTLLFGQIRYVDWESVQVTPVAFGAASGGASLVGLTNTTSYTLGVGRRFSEKFAGAVSIQYEEEGDPLVSPLGPSTGKLGITLAGTYTQGNVKFTGGINYTKAGDATPATANTARATFSDTSALGVGFRVGYSF